jgi:hypothetical protein
VIYFLLTGGANEKISEFPLIVNSHVLLGAVYLLMAPLQFSKTLRARSLNFHRWSERFLVSFGLVAESSALFMGIVIPFAGTPEHLIIFFRLVVFAIANYELQNCPAEKIQLHREWMIRALALGLSIATMRLIFVPVLILNSLNRQETEMWSILSLTIAFVPHCGFAEFWIRKTRT